MHLDFMIIPKISSKLAEEIGWHIGDGSMNFYKQENKLRGLYQLRGHIEDDRQHYIKRVKPLFESVYNMKIKLREMPSTRVFGFQIWNNDLVEFKQKLGLPLGKKLDIIIPKLFLTNNKLKAVVIRGIFDTDGGIYLEKKNNKIYLRVYIKTICPTLARQLQEVFKELNLRATLYSQISNREDKRKRIFTITIRGEQEFHKFMKIISPKNPKHIRKYNLFINKNLK